MTTLPELATDMKRQAAADLGRAVRRQLTGGLRLVMLTKISRHQLSLIRAGVEPSPGEVEVIRRDFSVPAEARLEKAILPLPDQQFYIVRLIWPRSGVSMTVVADEGDRVVVKI